MCFLFIKAQAQDNQFKEPIPRTPNAASLGKYGDVPVSYHTGVPNISIPIYTVEEGDLSLPISISYHSSGIKVDEVASWVGLGWALNAGGVISRTIMGGRDEGLSIIDENYSSRSGWGWYKNRGAPPEINNQYICDPTYGSPNQNINPNNPIKRYTNRSYFVDAGLGVLDTEPDIYTFNFHGYSGKFFFDENRRVYTIPWEDFYIEPLNEQLSEWLIVSPDGKKFYFGGSNATEKNYTAKDGGVNIYDQFNTSTSWYLYRIESVNGKSWINIDYSPEEYGFGDRLSHSVIFKNSMDGGVIGVLKRAPSQILMHTVFGKRISKITTSSGNIVVDFIANNIREDLNDKGIFTSYNKQAKALSSIIISGKNDVCKKFEINTSYFLSAASGGYVNLVDTKRLKLNSIVEKSCDGSISNNPYIFTYNTRSMARRYSLARDHWGYYNGRDANIGLIPNGLSVPGRTLPVNGNADRSISETDTKSLILEKIQYPTKGYTEFQYQIHKDEQNKNIGGLRISKITINSGSDPDIVKTFTYEDPQVYCINPNVSLTNYYVQYPNNNPELSLYYYSPHAVFGYIIKSSPPTPQYTTQGYHIGYRAVNEISSNGSKTKYVYSDINAPYIFGYPEIPSQSPIGKGQLVLMDKKRLDGTTVSYTYNNYLLGERWKELKVKRVVNVIDYSTNANGEWNDQYAVVQLYDLKTVRGLLSSKVEILDGVTTTTNYKYDVGNIHGNPVKIITSNSKGQTIETDILYPSDAGSGAPVQMYDPTNSKYKNMLGVAINQKTKVNGLETSKSHNNYTYNSSDDMIHLTSTRVYPTGSTEYKDVFFNYDLNDNIISVQPQFDKKISYIWSINNSLPVIKGDNVDYNTLQGAVNTAVASVGYANLNSLMNALVSKMHNGTGNLRVTWNSFNTSLRNNSTLSNALIYTYTYDPLAGMTSQTDPSGITTYYEYDPLVRLRSISDFNNHILNSYQYIYKQ
ncbi:MAG: hypothetical protein HC819_23170 [Cyclobacteriaceae bacterium]|nr:hypothetical protein [Cyclobacteriaceae bacterium]